MSTSINLHNIKKITIERDENPADEDCTSFKLIRIKFVDDKEHSTSISVFSDDFIDIEELIGITEPEPQHLKMKSREYEEGARMDDLIPETPPFLNEQNS